MVIIHSTLFWFHIIFGSLAMVLFWVPLFSKKGQLNHRRFGSYYKTCMYLVALAGGLMSIMVVAWPEVIKAAYLGERNYEEAIFNIRMFWAFLGLLSLFTFVTTRHGIVVLRYKNERRRLKQFSYLFPVFCLFFIAMFVLVAGILRQATLHIIFGILALLMSLSILQYVFKKNVANNQWVLEHIGHMIGSGIAAYTAFLSFGGRRILNVGEWEVLFWIAPGVIGSIASYIITKKYRKLFHVKVISAQ